ncbi:hypothetical protein bcgnr5372_37530 [Bacillus luti]
MISCASNDLDAALPTKANPSIGLLLKVSSTILSNSKFTTLTLLTDNDNNTLFSLLNTTYFMVSFTKINKTPTLLQR